MPCPVCGTENETGRKFCGECGASLALACANCGTPNPPTVKFCGECGALLVTGTRSVAEAATAPVAERRLVSVLFADLVGFTTLSEARDSEEVRDLLSRYFETSRQIIGRYGGTIEKFIGDAVMAIWGAPVATENDAELAVRAGLDLTAAVTALGQEIDASELRARAGILTGEGAVTIGAEGQGMVAGDLVNTASRIQSAAPPGAVFVGESTRRASDASIAFEDAGEHELKGKAEPVALWRAVRVLSGVGGAQKSTGLEAPFVGRERELRLIKELFHASVEERKAHLVSVTGAAGIGKSRLSWEFFKYMDGLVDDFRWHRGRCLSYGEGVAFWALAEMVRTRCSIAEGEDPAPAAAKLRTAVKEAIPDPEERRWVEPRLANLLGLEERGGKDQEGLFAAWRLFYERLADEMPTIMVFEDMQWADVALLDFVEYLLEWSRAHPLFIVVLSRPELAERRPTWGAGRGVTSIYLDPLPRGSMEPADRTRARLGRGPAVPDPGPRRGRPALRDGDGSDAARPRSSRAGGLDLPPHGLRGNPRGPRDAARADRGPARRAHGRRATVGAGRGGARQDLHEAGDRRGNGDVGGGGRAAARVPRAQGGPVAPRGSDVARARAVRLPAGPGEAGRV
jgi:class 3 adenylate cyclase